MKNTANRTFLALALICLGAVGSLFTKEITVSKRFGIALQNTLKSWEEIGITPKISVDLQEIAQGIKDNRKSYPQSTYAGALSSLMNLNCSLEDALVKSETRKTFQNKLETALKADKTARTTKIADITKCISITQEDINNLNGAPYVISDPGTVTNPRTYCFQEDITFTPTAENSFAFIINADNVVIDLGGHTLSQSAAAQNFFAVVGFELAPGTAGHHNIAIQNGSITRFQGAAIDALVPATPLTQIALDTLSFNNLTIINNGDHIQHTEALNAGLFAQGINLRSSASDTELFGYKNITLDSTYINGSTLGGLSINAIDGLAINNVTCNDTTLNVGTFGPTACVITNGRNIRISQSTFNNTQHNDPTPTFSFTQNLVIQGCTNIILDGVQANNCFAEAALFVFNSNFSASRNLHCKDSQFNNARGGALTSAVSSMHTSGSELVDGFTFIDTQFNGSTRAAEGEPLDTVIINVVAGPTNTAARNVTFQRCESIGHTTDNPFYRAIGYYAFNLQLSSTATEGIRNFTWKDSIASDLSAPGEVVGYLYRAFNTLTNGSAQEVSNPIFERCIAEHLRSSSTTQRVTGISVDLLDATESIFGDNGPYGILLNPFVNECRISDLKGGNKDSAGIYYESVKNPVIVKTSVTDCPNGIIFTGSNLINPPTLFQLAINLADATAQKPLFIDLTSIPEDSPVQTFRNTTRNNEINIPVTSTTVSVSGNTLFSPEDLNALGWKAGDSITYLTNGTPPIGGLASGATYFLVAYVPGFTDFSLVQDNYITNCALTGIRDNRCPTSSAFVTNTAFNNGKCLTDNYKVNWGGHAPVCKEPLSNITECERPFNLALGLKEKKKHASRREHAEK